MFRALKFGLLGIVLASSFGIFASGTVARAADLKANYEEINSVYNDTTQKGIIFAGICDTAAPSETSADTCPCRASGNCTLDDVLQVFVNLSTFILGISGTAVLFVFIYGGFKWTFSRGDSKWITAGKNAITASVIGLCIIFGAYVAINFIVAGLIARDGAVPESAKLEETVDNGYRDSDKPASPASDVFTTE